MNMPRLPVAAVAAAFSIAFIGALGVQDYEVDGVKVTLVSVKRVPGDKLDVRWQYQNTTSSSKALGESFSGMGSSEAYSLTWGVYAVDPAKNMKYGVMKQPNGEPVAGSHGPGKRFMLGANKTYSTWAQLVAPPPDVKTVTIFIPGAPPFENITIGT